MNPATLFAIRKGLGLSQDGLGQLTGRKRAMVSLYESGERPIPDDLALTVQQVLKSVDVAAAQAYNYYCDQFADLEDDDKHAVLLIYKQDDYHRWKVADCDHWPLTDLHTAVCNRLAFLLSLDGWQVRFVTFDWDTYHQWLGNRPDTTAHRSLWAAEQNG